MISFPRICSFLIAGGVLTTLSQAQTTSTVITACVSKFDGFSRIVAKPNACLPRFETIVQWNSRGPEGPAGPAGPTGPQGPQGPQGTPAVALAHTILVSASGTPEENGLAFQTAVASITNASAINPYLVQLDAGTFTLPMASSPGMASETASQGHATILGTQVQSFSGMFYAPGVVACFSVYDLNLQPYPAGCVSSAP